MASVEVIKSLMVMADLYGKEMSPEAADMLADDLDGHPEPAVIKALRRCRQELRTFPTLAEILARIEDGRPGADEAWALIPKTEEESICWTEEMQQAYGIAAPLMATDKIAARLAFREAYLKRVSDARSTMKPTRWQLSLGSDKAHRESTVREAVRKRLIAREDAQAMLPELQLDGPPPAALLTGPTQADGLPEPDLERLDGIVDRLLKGAPQFVRAREQLHRIRRAPRPRTPEEQEAAVRRQLEQIKKSPGG